MGKKLHVENLTYSVTHTDLEEWFAQYETVQSAQVITDRDTGRSKGFGFVEMDTDAQAQAAILGLHDQDHDGRRPRWTKPSLGSPVPAVVVMEAVAVGGTNRPSSR